MLTCVQLLQDAASLLRCRVFKVLGAIGHSEHQLDPLPGVGRAPPADTRTTRMSARCKPRRSHKAHMALLQHDKLSDSGQHGALHVNIQDFTRLRPFPEEVVPNRG